jgi:biopolymer transport protein ExbB/TolQ
MTRTPVWIVLVILLLSPGVAAAWDFPWDKKKGPNPNLIRKKKQLDAINARLQRERDKLQRLIAERWKKKQSYVARRETDKETLTQLREAQQRTYREEARVKEECFAREKTIEDAKSAANDAKAGFKHVKATFEEKLEKEADKINGSFPLDLETRRQTLEQVRSAVAEKGTLAGLDAYINYLRSNVLQGTAITLGRERILPDSGRPVTVQLARFGSVFAYGMNEANSSWVITQTGRLGAGRFSVTPVEAQGLRLFLTKAYPGWIAAGVVSGPVLTDIIQNAQSKNLISGKKLSRYDELRKYFDKGGVTMYPLLFLPIWALLIILYKFFQLGALQRLNRGTSRKVVAKLEQGDVEGARALVKKRGGTVARVVAACLQHSDRTRESAEQAVKEVMVNEVPALNRHLSTLAVIAGAAPLLGLLGTVTGMISLFEVITNYGTGDPKIMAAGISEALITTQTGLIVAIPILLIHNMLRNRKNRLQDETERSAVVILNRIWPGTEGTPEPTAKSEPDVEQEPKDDLAAEGEPELAGGP